MNRRTHYRIAANTVLAVLVSAGVSYGLYWAVAPHYFDETLAVVLPVALPATIAPVMTYTMARVQERLRLQKVALEDARARNREFLGNLSHELRTPLNAIIGFSEMIGSQALGPESPKYQEYARDINVSGRHLLSLVNDLMDLSRIDSGRFEIVPEDLDLDAMIADLSRACAPLLQEWGTRLDTTGIAPGATVWADRRALSQVLLNLVTNAVKYGPEDGTVCLRFRDGRSGAELAVADDGPGMTPEEVETALTRFGRVDRDGGTQGVGLGLPIVEGLIGLHGGRLSINSKPDRGTTVSAWFPRKG